MITKEKVRSSTWKVKAIARMARGGYVRLLECSDLPRLGMRVFRATATDPAVVAFMVDDQPCDTLEAAIEALNL